MKNVSSKGDSKPIRDTHYIPFVLSFLRHIIYKSLFDGSAKQAIDSVFQ